MRIQYVPPEWVPRVWPQVCTHIENALDHSCGDYNIEHARTMLATGQWILLVAVGDDGLFLGAAAVHLFNRPTDRVAFIIAIGGRLITNQDTFAQMRTILQGFGATCIEGAARESIARLWKRYGFATKYSIVGVKL